MKVFHIWTIGADGSISRIACQPYGYKTRVLMRYVHDPFKMTDYYGDESTMLDGINFYQYAILACFDFDIIHIHGVTELVAMIRSRYPDKKIIIHYHGSDIANCSNNELRISQTISANAICYSTPDLAQYLPDNAIYIPNAINTNLFRPIECKKDGAFIFKIRYLDWQKVINFVDKFNIDYEIIDRETNTTPFYEMPVLYNKYKMFIDVKGYSNRDGIGQAYSKSGLEALACGLTVLNHAGEFVQGLPEIHTIEHKGKILNDLYKSLCAA